MSIYQFIACDYPLKEVSNPFVRLLSINDMIENNMEIPTLLLKSETDKDAKIILHCDSEDNLDEITISTEKNIPKEYVHKYTKKKYISSLTWRYTERRAEQLIKYIKEQLIHGDEIEVWNTWMDEEFEEVTVEETSIQNLTISLIKETLDTNCHHSVNPVCLRITLKNHEKF